MPKCTQFIDYIYLQLNHGEDHSTAFIRYSNAFTFRHHGISWNFSSFSSFAGAFSTTHFVLHAEIKSTESKEKK